MNKAVKFVILSAGAYGCYQVGKIVGVVEMTKIYINALDEAFPEANVKKVARECIIKKLLTKEQ